MDTGFPTSDAQFDFSRARRARVLAQLGARLRGEPSDLGLILPFEEVVEALGRTGEHDLGRVSISLESIVGSVDRHKEFDRRFRPTSGRIRPRWERIADAQRRGTEMPPISVHRVGELHFVRDGHHRVSVARALGRTHIDAYATEVTTRVGAHGTIRAADLPMKSHERVFLERVPLTAEQRDRVRLSDAWRYAELAEGVEAWGFRVAQGRGEYLTREQVARDWMRDEYLPVVGMLREADLVGRGTEADAYMRVAAERYRLMRTHVWNEEIVERLRQEMR